MTEEIPQQYTHSIKLEETAKGVRVHIHVYTNDSATAMTEALSTYQNMRNMLDKEKIPLAPMEIKQ